MAVHLYTWRGETPWRIYGPTAGESGRWYCTCPNGMRHLGRRVNGVKPPRCSHLANLWDHANQGELSGRFKVTRSGSDKADAGCACNDGRPLVRLPPPQAPPAGPKPGEPSRNRPCPCGSGLNYKQCHGREGGPPAGVPPMPGEVVARVELPDVWTLEKALDRIRAKQEARAEKARARRRVPVILAVDKAAAKRAEKKRAEKERNERIDARLALEHAKDEARRAARRKRDAEKKGAAKG